MESETCRPFPISATQIDSAICSSSAQGAAPDCLATMEAILRKCGQRHLARHRIPSSVQRESLVGLIDLISCSWTETQMWLICPVSDSYVSG